MTSRQIWKSGLQCLNDNHNYAGYGASQYNTWTNWKNARHGSHASGNNKAQSFFRRCILTFQLTWPVFSLPPFFLPPFFYKKTFALYQESNIGKLMRKITTLEIEPDPYMIKSRCLALMQRYRRTLENYKRRHVAEFYYNSDTPVS